MFKMQIDVIFNWFSLKQCFHGLEPNETRPKFTCISNIPPSFIQNSVYPFNYSVQTCISGEDVQEGDVNYCGELGKKVVSYFR